MTSGAHAGLELRRRFLNSFVRFQCGLWASTATFAASTSTSGGAITVRLGVGDIDAGLLDLGSSSAVRAAGSLSSNDSRKDPLSSTTTSLDMPGTASSLLSGNTLSVLTRSGQDDDRRDGGIVPASGHRPEVLKKRKPATLNRYTRK